MPLEGPLLGPHRIRNPLPALVQLILVGTIFLIASFGWSRIPEAVAATPNDERLAVYVFWRAGCPYCAKAIDYVERLAQTDPRIGVRLIEVGANDANLQLFIEVNAQFDIEQPVVPITVIGDRAFIGFLDDATTGAQIGAAARACLKTECPAPIAALIRARGAEQKGDRNDTTIAEDLGKDDGALIPRTVELPLIGEISTASLSMPLLTIVLAAVDGFNPCAMWVLVFLIGLLLGMDDHRRMWVLGGAFLVASAAVYFVFMAAWLNFLLLFGALLWIRIAVGLFALGGGAYYLREYVLGADDVCKVTSPGRRRRIIEALKETVHRRRFAFALWGIIILAFAVNLIELLCSAGIPAVYIKILTMSNLPPWQYYGYLLLYIAVFLFDDLVVFATAMVTLQTTGLTARYTRYSHLIGGIVLTVIGGLLLLRPEWLVIS